MPNRSTFTPSEIRILIKQARLLHRQPELDIRYKARDPNTSRLPGRILIITPRKMGTAPKRNLVRRRLKALFYEEHLFKYGFDVVVYCRKGSANLSFQELKDLLLTHFPPQTTSTNKIEELY